MMCVLSAYSMVKCLCPTSQVLNFLSLLINLLKEPENIPTELNYTDATVYERRIFPPTVMIFRNFLFNILPNSLNCFQTELDCHPNSLRKFYGYISLYWKMQAFSFHEEALDFVSMHKGPDQAARSSCSSSYHYHRCWEVMMLFVEIWVRVGATTRL